jgi:hypothetical protein
MAVVTANGNWVIKLALGLATAGVLGAIGTYAQVRDNTSDIVDAKEMRKETRNELKEIRKAISANATAAATTRVKVDAIYNAVVKKKDE